MAQEESEATKEPTLVEKWIEDQQQWQRTVMSYLDSMAKNDDFLVHLGNAMRGSLLAGKPYPGSSPAAAAAPEAEGDDRLDRVLHKLHQIEGQLNDLQLTVDELHRRYVRLKVEPDQAGKSSLSKDNASRGSGKEPA
jgi:hypothetical protein